MSSSRPEELSPVKRALLEVRSMRARLEESERIRTEAIAIVGIGLRLPGGISTCEAFWTLLREGGDAIGLVPRERWDAAGFFDADPDVPGKISTRFGGFLDRIDQFDARFFGITPREAASMDPQQRLLLEVAWEALEHAGQAPDALAGQPVGVFVGLSSTDYMTAELKFSGATEIDAYLATGGHPSVASGRVSYALGLQGPSLTVDTACSSSLTAIHLAAQSLRLGECRMALAGGVSLLLLPELSINFSRARMMAPDGRCKTFDGRADGYVRSEGCGVIVLKRLSDAVKHGDRILALISGSAINQDGRSSGLTVPNGPAQEAVIREALSRAGVAPAQVSYVEAHGTGTALGDPIELRALGSVFGAGRDAGATVAIGSVKTNLGHLEAAAGVAGLIKVVLALQHGEIPANLHFVEPTPHVDWTALPLHVPTAAAPWARTGGPRVAGVSAFGFSGTNAHVVISEAPPDTRAAGAHERPLHLLAISGKTGPALRESAARLASHLAGSPDSLADVCYTAGAGRAHFPERAAIVAGSLDEAGAALTILAAGGTAPAIVSRSSAAARRPEVAFLFAGYGVQYAGMGRELFETQPAFRRTLEKCDQLLRPHLERPLLSVLYPAPGELSPIDEAAYGQPALFAFEYALAELWRSWGVQPTFVLGHSLGEDVAACVAGVFGLEQGLTMVARRGRLIQSSMDEGGMVAVFAPPDRVRALIAAEDPALSIAALNGPQHVVVSGPRAAVAGAVERFHGDGLKVRPFTTARGCHSAVMDPVLDEIEQLAAGMTLDEPRLAVVSTVTGKLAAPGELTDPRYWRRHVRETVRFNESVEALYAEGARVVLEIGPSGTLISMGRRCVTTPDVVWLQSLEPGEGDWSRMLPALGAAYASGVPVKWEAFDRDYTRRRVALPAYPFQRERHWSDAVRPRTANDGGAGWHPLGRRLHSPALTDIVYQSEIGLGQWPLLGDHRVNGAVLVPASVYAEMALGAAPGARVDFEIEAPLVLDADGARLLQLVMSPAQTSFAISSMASDESAAPVWIRHATGTASRSSAGAAGGRPDGVLQLIRDRCDDEIDGGVFYDTLAGRGLQMGPGFRAVRRVWRGVGEALGEVEVPAGGDAGSGSQLHPVLFDACFQVASTVVPEATPGAAYLLVAVAGLVVRQPGALRGWSHVKRRNQPGDAGDIATASMAIFDDAGEIIAEAETLTFRRARGALTVTAAEWRSPWLCELAWRARPLLAEGGGSDTAPFADLAAIGARVQQAFPALAEASAMAVYVGALADVDRLATEYIVQALHDLAVVFTPGTRVTRAAIMSGHGLQARHARLVDRFLHLLAEDGILRADGDAWVALEPLPAADPPGVRSGMPAGGFSADPERTLTAHCASQLAKVLRGTVDPVQLLFPGGSTAGTEQVYAASPSARLFNGLVREAIADIVRSLPAGRTLRVLEVGAGTGATTAPLLPLLAAVKATYTFTDVSPLFLEKAREKFDGYGLLDYRTLDLERDPEAQGFAAHSFDVVIAVNVLHATSGLEPTLQRVRTLLAPGGVLLLGEATTARRWLDVTFGLTEGWWKFSDADLRSVHPLLDRQQWLTLLDRVGFTDGVSLPAAHGGVADTQALFVARAPVGIASSRRPHPAGAYIVLADAGGLGAAAADLLRARGCACVIVRQPGMAPAEASEYRIDPAKAGAFDAVVAAALGDQRAPLAGCLHFWSLDAPAIDDLDGQRVEAAWEPAVLAALHLVQALAQSAAEAPLWMVTSSAVAVDSGDHLRHAGQAPLWGFGRVVALEHPDLSGGLIDVDLEDPGSAAARIVAEVLDGDGEDQVALRGSGRFVARLAQTGRIGAPSMPLRVDGTYLITGGMGRLGLEVARWLAQRGARHLTLVSRAGLPNRAEWPGTPPKSEAGACIAAVREIEAIGAAVTVVAADVADPTHVARLFAPFGRTAPALRGVVHAASETGTARITALTADAMRSMLRPKVTGTWLLHQYCAPQPLDFFVAFSSTTGVLGSVEMAHYAAANTFLDAFAQARRSAAFPVTSIVWGAWDRVQIGSSGLQRALDRAGLRLMSTTGALEAFGRLLHPAAPGVIVVNADWPALKTAYESGRRRPLLDEIGAPPLSPPRSVGAAPAPRGEWLRELERADPGDRRELLSGHITREAARVLRVDAEALDPAQGLFDLGMDSLMSVELRGRLEAALDRKLPVTLTFNYPSVGALTEFVARQILEIEDGSSGAAPAVAVAAVAPPVADRPAAADSIDDMSESELAALLTGKLANLR